jgi:transmembrane 9 superfamily protein 2/4
MGFALGSSDWTMTPESARASNQPTGPLLHNHYDMTILYHPNPKKNTYRVVGVLVVPKSVKSEGGATKCDSMNDLSLNEGKDNSISFSYSVSWKESNTPWGTRWDLYLHMPNEKIHWFR